MITMTKCTNCQGDVIDLDSLKIDNDNYCADCYLSYSDDATNEG